MEKRLQKIILTLLLFISPLMFAQDVSQERMIRFALWASMEAFPGVEKVEKGRFCPSCSENQGNFPLSAFRNDLWVEI